MVEGGTGSTPQFAVEYSTKDQLILCGAEIAPDCSAETGGELR